jgi:hypothetical protein
MKLTFWRSAFALAVHASAGIARIVRATEARFYDACLRETLTRPANLSDYHETGTLEAQRRSFAYGQVAMHNDTITRADVDRVADAMAEPWACVAGDVEGHDAGTVDDHDLHGDVLYPSSGGARGWEA